MDMKTQVLGALARGYCSPDNSHKELDVVLINAMADEIIKEFTPIRTYDDGVLKTLNAVATEKCQINFNR